MRKLHIGTVIKQINGQPRKFVEKTEASDAKQKPITRDMTLRDVIIDLYPVLGDQKTIDARIITDAIVKIYNCKEEWVELENHDYVLLKGALEKAPILVWVQTVLVVAFEESDAAYAKKETQKRKLNKRAMGV